jgi:hypothetical protein
MLTLHHPVSMRNSLMLFASFLMLFALGCKEDPSICANGRSDMLSHTFEGLIYRCDAHLSGTATVTAGTGDLVEIHVVADSAMFDTTLTFTAECIVVEETIPLIRLHHPTITDEYGQFNRDSNRISFYFEHSRCGVGEISFFEGRAH